MRDSQASNSPTSCKFSTGVVLRRTRSFYYVDLGPAESRLCRIRGNLFQDNVSEARIAVGDVVEVEPDAAEDAGWICEVHPRHSRLARRSREGLPEQTLVANAEQLLIVAALKRPEFRHGVVDRLIVAGLDGGLTPVLVLNKTDLGETQETATIRKLYTGLGYSVLLTSATKPSGLETLHACLRKRTSVLAGHSGVGKSSLVKALYPDWEIRVGAVNQKRGKGRHTTTMAEMFRLPEGGYLVDTPGIRELEPLGVTRKTLDQHFVEFAPLWTQCRFASCSHRHEPDCAVQQGVAEGAISAVRYRSYVAFWESLES
ncbi:MAG: ribosome small subunit-dependent GTPase A [Deltaproteobacteria bacterium]|nr:ribosome small subunit-dependent GTPase A [Deltaproteobacteria bacterium]